MPAPPPTEKNGSFLSMLLAAAAGFLVFGGMLAVCAILFGPAVFVFAAIFGGGVFTLAVFHYLVWGWWLGRRMQGEPGERDADPGSHR